MSRTGILPTPMARESEPVIRHEQRRHDGRSRIGILHHREILAVRVENRLTGEQALAFVRQRYGLPGSDFDRIRRQQQFIGAVFAQATSTGMLANPVRLQGLLRAAMANSSSPWCSLSGNT